MEDRGMEYELINDTSDGLTAAGLWVDDGRRVKGCFTVDVCSKAAGRLGSPLAELMAGPAGVTGGCRGTFNGLSSAEKKGTVLIDSDKLSAIVRESSYAYQHRP
jgi:hypothetical protein